jgi:phage baseplate assembly protein W
MSNGDIVGRGFAYPFRVDARRRIVASEGEPKVRDSIVAILGTQPGERLMRPTFGCALRDLVFAPNTPATASLARYRIAEALTRWEPRVALVDVAVENRHDGGSGSGPELAVRIDYRVIATGSLQRLEFAFPLI